MKKLIIYSDVFIWEKGDDVIFYNSQSFNSRIFKAPHSSIMALCKQLNDPDNLYEIDIAKDSETGEVGGFIEAIVLDGFGNLVDKDMPTISLPPFLNVQSQIKRKSEEHKEDVLLEYFTNLTIHLGGGDIEYPDYFRQTHFPISSEPRLANDRIINFLENNKTPYLHDINLIASAIDGDLYGFIDFLKGYNVNTVVYIIGNNQNDILEVRNRTVSSNIHICIICLGHTEPDRFYNGIEDCEFNFIVRSQEEYEKYELDIKTYGISNFSFVPIYDNNLEFFENNIFLSEEDIKSSRLSKRHVFINQSINSNFFGSFTIMPDGKIYSNVNKPAIGTLGDKIYTLIDKEMRENHAWRYIRNQKPCSDCLYQWLCPAPSNYEIVIGRSNLCLIR